MKCNTNIQAFIFDLGKVIVDWGVLITLNARRAMRGRLKA